MTYPVRKTSLVVKENAKNGTLTVVKKQHDKELIYYEIHYL